MIYISEKLRVSILVSVDTLLLPGIHVGRLKKSATTTKPPFHHNMFKHIYPPTVEQLLDYKYTMPSVSVASVLNQQHHLTR